MLVLSLRVSDEFAFGAEGVDPRVAVAVGDAVVAADIEGPEMLMERDADGRFLAPDLRVAFQVEMCCFACRDAVVRASLVDAGGRGFAGEVGVLLTRGAECPDAAACCADAASCPDPEDTQICR